jgi:hypothetical protein
VAFGSRRISLAKCSLSSFVLFVSVCVQVSLSSGDATGGSQCEVQALSARIRAVARHWCSVSKKIFTSKAR